MLNGFKEFITRGNVLDLAVAVVIGAAFTAVVTAVVDSLINPLIGAIFQADSLNTALMFTIPGTDATLAFGAVFGAILNFVIIAAVVYFAFVMPANSIMRRAEAKRKAGEVEADAPVTEIAVLEEIRDLLAGHNDGKHSS